MGFAGHFVTLIRSLYENQRSKIQGDTSGWFQAKQGVRQPLQPNGGTINEVYALEGFDNGFKIGGMQITNLRCADDTNQ